jgi:hypothetical protein
MLLLEASLCVACCVCMRGMISGSARGEYVVVRRRHSSFVMYRRLRRQTDRQTAEEARPQEPHRAPREGRSPGTGPQDGRGRPTLSVFSCRVVLCCVCCVVRDTPCREDRSGVPRGSARIATRAARSAVSQRPCPTAVNPLRTVAFLQPVPPACRDSQGLREPSVEVGLHPREHRASAP